MEAGFGGFGVGDAGMEDIKLYCYFSKRSTGLDE